MGLTGPVNAEVFEIRKPCSWLSRRKQERPRETTMASDSSPSEQFQTGGKKRPAGLLGNAMKRKDGFIQLFFMTGILLLSMRSLGQKHRINDLLEDTAALKEEQDSLAQRMHHIKSRLLHEASLDSTGLFASRLGRLFNETDT